MEQSETFCHFLLEHNLISSDQYRVALVESKRQGKPTEDILIQMGFLEEQVVLEMSQGKSKLPLVDISKVILDPLLLENFPREIALRHSILPLFQRKKQLWVAMVNPGDLLAIDAIKRAFPESVDIRRQRVRQTDLKQAIERGYGYNLSLEAIFKEMDATRVSDQQSYANPTVRLVDRLLIEAVKNHASDIHLEPEQHFIRVRHRIDGALRQVILFHERHWAAICVRLKILANMDIAETRMPQSGRFSLKVGGSNVDFRVATHPTYFGENMVLRLLDKTNGVRSLERLSLSKGVVARLRGVLKIPQGLIVVTGPTGSGKTTTLYALLQELGMMSCNLMTLEQPIEYQLPLVRQTEI